MDMVMLDGVAGSGEGTNPSDRQAPLGAQDGLSQEARIDDQVARYRETRHRILGYLQRDYPFGPPKNAKFVVSGTPDWSVGGISILDGYYGRLPDQSLAGKFWKLLGDGQLWKPWPDGRPPLRPGEPLGMACVERFECGCWCIRHFRRIAYISREKGGPSGLPPSSGWVSFGTEHRLVASKVILRLQGAPLRPLWPSEHVHAARTIMLCGKRLERRFARRLGKRVGVLDRGLWRRVVELAIDPFVLPIFEDPLVTATGEEIRKECAWPIGRNRGF